MKNQTLTNKEAKRQAINYINDLVQKYGEDDVIPAMQNIVAGANKWYSKLAKKWVANLPEMEDTTLHSFGIRFFIKTVTAVPNQPGGPSIWAKVWLIYSNFWVDTEHTTQFNLGQFKDEKSWEVINTYDLTYMNHRTFEDAKYDIDDDGLCTSLDHDSYDLPEISFEEIFAWKDIHKCESCDEWLTDDEVHKDSNGFDLCEKCYNELD